ncbi:HNH endonuclease signature motif containing protein [Streptococcus sp. ZJ93]|uniref:HNH endonuclease n=1 Tax=Streptococcus handemini TaxID=3161188 RepID=UPI0032ED4658
MQVRADRKGKHRVAFEKNKKIILKTRNVCGICGNAVDKSLKYPHPLSPVIDHIIPVIKNGHPSDIDNLQLAHWQCNRQKSDKLYADERASDKKVIGNRNLPQSCDWISYKG